MEKAEEVLGLFLITPTDAGTTSDWSAKTTRLK
jgi:hypothetical protein